MDDFDQLRTIRPHVPAARDEVIAEARAALRQQSAAEHTADVRSSGAPVVPLVRRWPALAAAAAVAVIGGLALTIGLPRPAVSPEAPTTELTPTAAHTAAAVLSGAADSQLLAAPISQPGQFRHLRFRSLIDPGKPVYEVYIRPNGTARLGLAGHRLEPTDGYLTAAQLATLTGDAVGMPQRMAALAAERRLGQDGERPERALYRLAVDLLADPGVPATTKAQVYRVLAGFDLDAIRARYLGQRTLDDGTSGVELEFQFDEGVSDRILLDPQTGSLLSDRSLLPDGTLLGGQQYLAADLVDSIPRTNA